MAGDVLHWRDTTPTTDPAEVVGEATVVAGEEEEEVGEGVEGGGGVGEVGEEEEAGEDPI